MTIIRVDHKRQYTVVTNNALRDPNLSFRATGLLAYILSFPDDFQISGRRLCEAKSEGRDAVFKALTELEEAGYLERTKLQGEDGKWTTMCTIREVEPGPDSQDSVPGNRTVTSSKPSPGKPGLGKPGLKDFVFLSNEEEVLGAAPEKPPWAQPDRPELKPKVTERAGFWEPEIPLTPEERKKVAARFRDLRSIL